MMDSSIFGLRFKANDAIHPSPDELQGFLESPKKEGRDEGNPRPSPYAG